MNLVVVTGRLSRDPDLRVLQSGDRLVSLDLTVPRPDDKAESVPVAWFDAPDSAAALTKDQVVVVRGRVRRRFFKAGDQTQSRTEVVAESVVPVTQKKRVSALLDGACRDLADAG